MLYLTVKKNRTTTKDILKDLHAHVTSSLGTTLTESNLNKMVTQIQLAQSLSPYQNSKQRKDYQKLIMGMFEQEYPGYTKKERSLEDFLKLLK